MKYFDSNKSLEITCPNCSKTFSKTLGSINREKQFPCPNCEASFDAANLVSGLQDAEKSVDKLAADFKKMFK